jgi:hypothetical protein
MPAKREAGLRQPSPPSILRPNRGRVVEQTMFLLLLGQARKLGVQRMIGREECLLAMENRRIRAGVVFEAIDLARAERQFDTAEQGRVRIGLEIGINEVRNFSDWRCSLMRLACVVG